MKLSGFVIHLIRSSSKPSRRYGAARAAGASTARRSTTRRKRRTTGTRTKSGDLHPDAGRRQAGGGAWLPVAVAASRAPRCLFVDARHAHRLSKAVAVANLATERHLRACAPPFRHLAGKEAAAMDVEPLLLLREDEAEVFLLVEPEHFTLHEACLPSVRSARS